MANDASNNQSGKRRRGNVIKRSDASQSQSFDDQYISDEDNFDLPEDDTPIAVEDDGLRIHASSKRTSRKRKRGRAVGSVKSAEQLVKDFLEERTLAEQHLELALEEIKRLDHLRTRQRASLIRDAYKRFKGVNIKDDELLPIIQRMSDPRLNDDGLLVLGEDNAAWYFADVDQHLVEDLYPARELSLSVGLSGAAKTVQQMAMLAAVLRGDSRFLGHKIVRDDELPWKVFYFGLDSSGQVYGKYAQMLGLANADCTGFVPGFNLIPRNAGWLITDAGVDELDDLLRTQAPNGGAIVVVDSLSAATLPAGIDENSTAIALALMDFKNVCLKYKATPIVLLHARKETYQDDIGAECIRGSSSIPSFAQKVISTNFLDQQATVGKKKLADKKSPLRRVTFTHRGQIVDLLVHFDFEAGVLTSYGDFEEALLMQNPDARVDPLSDKEAALQLVQCIQGVERQIFLLLLKGGQYTRAEIQAELNLNTSSVRRAVMNLLGDRRINNIPVAEEIPVVDTEAGRPANKVRLTDEFMRIYSEP